MASYNPTTNFTAKDALAAGDPSKIIRGADFGVEFDAISTAINDIPEAPFVSVVDYGATGDGVTDDTAAIQSAINYASNNGIENVYIPAGHYKFSVLRMYHDATDNPNFQESPNRDGRVNLFGDGRLADNNLKAMTTGFSGLYGTILDSTGDGIIVDPTDAFDDTDARKFEMRHLTVVANNTGYVITNRSCPQFTLTDVSIKQLNTMGAGILNRNGWFTTIDRCTIFGPSDTGDAAANTRAGIVGQTDFFAGLWNIQNSHIDHWAVGISWSAGQFVNVCIRDTAIQNCNTYGFATQAGKIFNLSLDNVYFENVNVDGTNYIYAATGTLGLLTMDNCFMLGGNTTETYTSGAYIKLQEVEAVSINNHYVFRPWKTFLDIDATGNSQNISGVVTNSQFTTDADLSAEPTIYLFDGILPDVHNCIWPAMSQGVHNTTGNIRLYDESVYGKYIRNYTDVSGASGITKFSFGDTEQTTATTPYRLSGAGIEEKTYYDLTHTEAGGLAVYMPNPNNVKSDGRVIIIRNNENSASAYPWLNVYIATATPPNGRLAQLSPGQAAMFIFDGKGTNGGDWKCIGIWGTDDNGVLQIEEDVATVSINGPTPALEWREDDNGNSRVRYAVNNAQLITSMYGDSAGTWGGITHQSREGDDPSSSSHVIYTYDPSNDYHWWGNRATGTQIVQLNSSGLLDVNQGLQVSGTTATFNAGIVVDGTQNTINATFDGGIQLDANSGGADDLGVFVRDASTSNASPTVRVQGQRDDTNVSQSFGGGIMLNKLRGDSYVVNGQHLGTIYFGGNHTDGTEANVVNSASISAMATEDFTSLSNVRTDLVFYTTRLGDNGTAYPTANTTTGTETARITGSGQLLVGSSTSGTAAKIVAKTDAAYTAGVEVRSAGLGANEWARINLINEEAPTNATTGIIYTDESGNLGFRNDNSSGTSKVINLIAGNTTAGAIYLNSSVTNRVASFDADGLKFGTDGAAANALDDYEEGTFTPVFEGTSTVGSGTYSTQQGSYTKVGRLVTFTINIVRSGVTVAPAGNLRLGGLPFTSSATQTTGGCSIDYAANFGTSNSPVGGVVTTGNDQIILRTPNSADARDAMTTAVSASGIGTAVQMTVHGHYYTD